MPKNEIDYSNTIIYKILCKNPNVTDVYVGHTTNFVQREFSHKQGCININSSNYNCKLYEVIRNNGGWSNWDMIIVQFFKCNNCIEARQKEQFYYEKLNANLNIIVPFIAPKPNVNIIKTPTEKKIYYCDKCNIYTRTKNQLNTHFQTNKHNNISESIFPTQKCKKMQRNFTCSKCDFISCNKYNYDKHLTTPKHVRLHASNQIIEDEKFQCECGKTYIHRTSLYNHKKKCMYDNSKIISENTSTTNILLNNDDGFVITTNNVEAARMFSSGFIINENGAASMDFRVESDSNQYALFVDSGNNQVVVGGTAGFGGALFSVNGAISSSSTITGTTGSFDVITGNNEVGTSLEVAGPITGSSFQGTKHILVNNGFYVNDNPFIQNSLYFGGTLQHNPFNWNDPQAIGGDPMTVANFDISDDDQNWGRILPFDVSKIEILCGLRPGAGAGDQFSLVLYTASRIAGAVTTITLTRVAQNGVTFDGSGKYTNNDLTYTGDLTAGTMIYVGVGTNTSSPSAKNARGYMSVTITAK